MNYAVILSGGTGTRLGADIPKQYIRVADKMIITYCVETLVKSSFVDGVCIVASPDWYSEIQEDISKYGLVSEKLLGFAEPGENRQLSILSGLNKIKENCLQAGDNGDLHTVLIHDAARPLLTDSLIERIYNGYSGFDGVMPVLPMKDTVYFSEDGKKVDRLVPREKIFAGQAPELFNMKKYLDACNSLLPDKILSINGSTEPAILAGMNIAFVDGDEGNFKITTKQDLERFQEIMK